MRGGREDFRCPFTITIVEAMRINKDEVEKVAKLARLAITDTEKEEFSDQISRILDYMELLEQWDTTGVEPTATVMEQVNVFREDTPRPCLSLEDALANAPDQEGGFFRVPKILDDR